MCEKAQHQRPPKLHPITRVLRLSIHGSPAVAKQAARKSHLHTRTSRGSSRSHNACICGVKSQDRGNLRVGQASCEDEGGNRRICHVEDQDRTARGRRLLRRELGYRKRFGDACGRAGNSRFGNFRRSAAGSLGVRAVPLLLASRASLLWQALVRWAGLSALWLLWTALSLGTGNLCAFLVGWWILAPLRHPTPTTDDIVFGHCASIWPKASLRAHSNQRNKASRQTFSHRGAEQRGTGGLP